MQDRYEQSALAGEIRVGPQALQTLIRRALRAVGEVTLDGQPRIDETADGLVVSLQIVLPYGSPVEARVNAVREQVTHDLAFALGQPVIAVQIGLAALRRR